MKISVTAEDIAQGRRKSSCDCPVALALNRQIPGRSIEVTTIHATFDATYWRCAFMPTEAVDFIAAFDLVGPSICKPFDFDIEVPG